MEAQSNHVIEATYYLTTLTKWGMIFEGSFGGNVFGQILDDMSWRRTIFLVFHVCFFVLILQFGTSHSNLNILHAEILYMVTLLIVSEWIFHVLVPLRSRIVKGTSREPVFITIEKKSFFFLSALLLESSKLSNLAWHHCCAWRIDIWLMTCGRWI